MNIDKILEKAFTSGDLASGGLMNPEQAAKFVQGIFDKSVITAECRREPMKANKKQIDKITYTSDILQKPNAVGTDPSATSKPTTTKVTLDAQEAIVAIDIGYDALEDSIESQGLMDTILGITAGRLGYEIDVLALHGNSVGATGTFLDILDGIFKQVTTHVLDAGDATLSDTILANALKKLPGKYLDNEAGWRFYVSHLARLDYVTCLAGKGVNEAFVRYLIEAKEPAYNGIPVRKVGGIKTEDVGGGASPVVYGSQALLVNPRNIVFGIHRDIAYEFQRQPRKRIVEVTITMRVDFKLEEEDAIVKITDIKHSV